MHKSHHIVFTTIYSSKNFLESLYENFEKFGHTDKVKVWIVGDKKTPVENASLAKEFSNRGLAVEYFDVDSQDVWGRKLDFYGRVPYNNGTRRNFGFLKALEEGCEIMISMDDDNFPAADDFIGFHSKTGQKYEGYILEESRGFHNLCEYLEFSPSRAVYHRGFPFRLRDYNNQAIKKNSPKDIRIGITEGLWLKSPDVDAITWLNGTVEASAYKGSDLYVLDQNTWTPLNTQNTSIVRELMPAFLALPMGWRVPGGTIDRYDDIWGGYFLQAIMQGSRYHVAFGRPIAEHRRNPHNYLDDLRSEFWGILLTDWLVERLKREFKPNTDIISQRTVELANFIINSVSALPAWCPKEIQEFVVYTGQNLNLWLKACQQIGV